MTLTLLTLVVASLHPQEVVSSTVTAQKVQIIKGKRGHQQPSSDTAVAPAQSNTEAKNDAAATANAKKSAELAAKEQALNEKENELAEKEKKNDDKKKKQQEAIERISNQNQREFNNAAGALAGEE